VPTSAEQTGAIVAGVTAPARLPVTVVTGTLGSGKTTLIAALLAAPDMSGTAVIVNELAEIGIDQQVLGDAGDGEVVLLSNGCLCCARGTDLAQAVRRLIGTGRSATRPIERILIETSGAADPAPILRQVCFDPQLRGLLRYGGVLCLFDAAFGEGMLAHDPVGYRQIALADMVLVTKTDLVDAADAAARIAALKSLNAAAVITSDKDQALAFLAGSGGPVGKAGSQSWLGVATGADEMHPAVIGTWSLSVEAAIDWPAAEQILRGIYDRHGDAILRTKGVIWTEGDPRPLVIHGIHRHFHRPIRLKAWEAEPGTRMVVIGLAGAAEAARAIEDALKRCRARLSENVIS
jgi:G3E family GTPase